MKKTTGERLSHGLREGVHMKKFSVWIGTLVVPVDQLLY
jgi:hypothetical protein